MSCHHDNCKAHGHARLEPNLMELEQHSLLGSWSAEARLAGCVACNYPAAVKGVQLDGYHHSVE